MRFLIFSVVLFLNFLVIENAAAQTFIFRAPKNDKEIIYMQRGACFGSCPQYSLTIYGDGKAIYKGERNVEKEGTYYKKLSRREIKRLENEFRKAGFFSLADEYLSRYSDLPETLIRFSQKGRTKEIIDVAGAPEELKKLEKNLDTLIEQAGWQFIEK